MTTHRFLMPMWEGGGTLPPLLGVARSLIARGHEVCVLADPTVEDDAEAAGCQFVAWRNAPHRTSHDPEQDLLKDWEVSNPIAMFRRARDRFLIGPAAAYASDTVAAIDEWRPDAVAPDMHLLGAILAGQSRGLPVAPIVPNIWMLPTPGAPASGPGFAPATNAVARARSRLMVRAARRLFDSGLDRLNEVRRGYDLPPLDTTLDQITATERVLVLTSPAFDFASASVANNVEYVGPVLDDPHWVEPWSSPWTADATEPLVLVGFSSTFQNQEDLITRTVAALDELPVRALVTTGQAVDSRRFESTDRVRVVASAPHSSLLEQAALVVTHAGHGTTMKSLAAGVPLVCIPMGRDQNDNAARVVHLGAGIRLKPSADVERIRSAVRAALDDSSLRENARRFAEVLAAEAATVDAAERLEALCRSAPLA